MRSLSKLLFVVCVSAMVSLSCFSGAIGDGSRVGGVDAVPTSSSVVVNLETPTRLTVTMTVVFEGDDASAMRTLFDIDADGNIIASEVTTYMEMVNGPLDPVDSIVAITLDGNGPMSVEMVFEVEGAEGTVDSVEPLGITFLETIQFPETDSSPTHTYIFDAATEFIGGDEPWENEFIGGDEPWENEFTSDDHWNEMVELDFSVFTPPEWEFDTTAWPTDLLDFLKPEGTEIEMEGAEVRDEFNTTFGALNGLVIKQAEHKIDILPDRISIVVDLKMVDMMTLNMTAVYLGESARGMREMMDSQADGTIQTSEVEQYLSQVNGPLEVVDSEVLITLDGQRPTDVTMGFGVVANA